MEAASSPRPSVTAVVLAYNRRDTLETVLDHLAELPVDEIVVADNGSSDGTAELAREHPARAKVIEMGTNAGIVARNRAVREARGEYLLMLDDDSYPLSGAIETMLATFARWPRTGVVGGLVNDLDSRGLPVPNEQPGSFDWWLRSGRREPAPPDGFAATFFPEGACMVRREAFLEAGGWFEPLFWIDLELDLAARLLQRDWDVRYLPQARFEHLLRPGGETNFALRQRLRVRNRLWYFWLRFPVGLAVTRVPGYLLFDLVESLYRRAPGAWTGGIADAWRQRDRIRGQRAPLSPELARRAELNRPRLHLELLLPSLRRVARRFFRERCRTPPEALSPLEAPRPSADLD